MFKTTNAVEKVINHCSLLRNQFYPSFYEMISLGKKCAKVFWFKMLGNFTICERGSREMNDVIESAWLSELRLAFSEPHYKTTTGPRETSRCNMAQSYKACREDFASNVNDVSMQVDVNRLLKNEVARTSVKSCLKFGGSSLSSRSTSAQN